MKLPILLALLSLPASAVVNIDYVRVANAGNAASRTSSHCFAPYLPSAETSLQEQVTL